MTEKLLWKWQTAKSTYDRSARDLPEQNVGDRIRTKPLPGDRTGRWPLGQSIQEVAPRPFVVDVNSTLYRRNRVDLRVAERPAEVLPVGGPEQHHPKQGHVTGTSAWAETVQESGHGEPHRVEDTRAPSSLAPCAPSTPAPGRCQTSEKHGDALSQAVYTRCGRLSRPPPRLDW